MPGPWRELDLAWSSCRNSVGGSLPWVAQISGFYLFQEPQGFACVQGDVGSLLGRTFGFPFRLQPKQLLLVVSYGKISQKISGGGGKVWYVKKQNKTFGLTLEFSRVTLSLWEFAIFASYFPVSLSNLSCLRLENYQRECCNLVIKAKEQCGGILLMKLGLPSSSVCSAAE